MLKCSNLDANYVFKLTAREGKLLLFVREMVMTKINSGGGDAWYAIISFIVGGITFIGSWIYCIAEYGYLFGVGLGWLPSIIVAVIVGALWPLILIGIILLFVFNK